MESVKASTVERHEDTQMLQRRNRLDLSPEAVTQDLRCMLKRRAVGPDEIASEIWVAGGHKLAERLSEFMRRVIVNGTVPPQWTGGRLARLYKGRGDSHRSLLIADHASKEFIHLVATATDCANMRK